MTSRPKIVRLEALADACDRAGFCGRGRPDGRLLHLDFRTGLPCVLAVARQLALGAVALDASTAAIVWLTRRYLPGAPGSGIPQVMAATDPSVPVSQYGLFVSIRLTVAKMVLTTWGLLAGLSLGREGPSVQVAAGIMQHARRWLPKRGVVSDQHGLLIAGGAAGIAAAFNTPLGGVMFAIEELSRRPEQRSSGLIMAAIVLAGLMSVSIYGNATYFGVISVPALGWELLGPGLLVAVVCGALGGLFSRLLIASTVGGLDRLSRLRTRAPVGFAALCGLAMAVIGLTAGGATFGSGYDAHARSARGRTQHRSAVHGAQVHGDLDHDLDRRAGWHLRAVAGDRRRASATTSRS